VIVLVPDAIRLAFELAGRSKPLKEHAIAQKLAEPLAKYAFSHRTIFDDYEITYAFLENEPHEVRGRSPQLTQNGLKAWII
jgi:hypothetical protein